MEETKWLKPSDSVSRNTVSLEKDDAQADPMTLSGKADTAGVNERSSASAAAPG